MSAGTALVFVGLYGGEATYGDGSSRVAPPMRTPAKGRCRGSERAAADGGSYPTALITEQQR
jgi:hypothetical protein